MRLNIVTKNFTTLVISVVKKDFHRISRSLSFLHSTDQWKDIPGNMFRSNLSNTSQFQKDMYSNFSIVIISSIELCLSLFRFCFFFYGHFDQCH